MEHRLFFQGARLRSEEMRMNNSQRMIWTFSFFFFFFLAKEHHCTRLRGRNLDKKDD